MSLLLVNIQSEKRNFIVNKAIMRRVNVYCADVIPDVHELLSRREITDIYIDLDSVKIDWLKYLKELRDAETDNHYSIVITSNRQDKAFIKELLYLGIVGFIPSKLDPEKTFLKLRATLKKVATLHRSRKHFRVKISPESPMKINFKSFHSDKLITGFVTDISVVAIAFRLDKPSDFKYYNVGDVIEKVQFRIKNKLVLLKMKIIKTGNISVGGYVSMSEDASILISQYIYKEMIQDFTNNSGSDTVLAF